MKRMLVCLLACMALSGCATIRDWWDELPTDPTVPTEPGQPPAGDDAVLYGNLRWTRGGQNASRAMRDTRVTIRNVNIVRGNVPVLTYAGDGLSVWPLFKENITQRWFIHFDTTGDGVYNHGGFFDWGRDNAAPRPMQHLNHGYSNWDGYPRSGTPWAAYVTDRDMSKRSNVVKGVWP
jgi:hypothetical protein